MAVDTGSADPLEQEAQAATPQTPGLDPLALATTAQPLHQPLRSTFGDGQPLGPRTPFGPLVQHIRVHADHKAARAATDLAAEAFTIGDHLFFAHGRFAPGQAHGDRVLGHELVHVAQHRQGRIPAGRIHRLSSDHGQHVAGGLGELTADLTSPVVVNRTVRLQAIFGWIPGYVPFGGPPALAPFPYEWVVRDRSTGAVVATHTTQTGVAAISYPRAGQFSVSCTLRGAAGSSSVSMDQDAVAEDAWLAPNLSSSSVDQTTLREIVDDFRQYIIDSAAATGSTGITARFLAAILSEEISNTDPWPIFTNNKAARLSEISDVGAAIERRDAGESVPNSDINHSVGVAQIKLSTAAQLQNLIPWREQTPGYRAPSRAQIASDFASLSTTTQRNLLTLLSWPKSNIQTAASLLNRLKNRPNRYPYLSRTSFAADRSALAIIATEYNLGASNSTDHEARASDYGYTISNRMFDPVISHYFPNA